jgi:hypothetical protein
MITTAGTWDLATWGELGSAVAAIIAAVTLVFVCVQIYLATEALKVARDEFKLVREDLDYTKQQTAIINRRADLLLSHKSRHATVLEILGMVGPGAHETLLWIDLVLSNSGDKTARDAVLYLWIPSPWRRVPWSTIRGIGGWKDFTTIGNVEIDSVPYEHVSIDVDSPTYPGVERVAYSFVAFVPKDSRDVLWRVAYDDGITPSQTEPSGRLTFAFPSAARG